MDNVAFVAIGALVVFIIIAMFKKTLMPIVYHCIELVVYFLACHYIIWMGTSLCNWYANETNPSEGYDFKTPAGLISQNFADKTLYNPTSLFYFEVIIAVALMYLVVVVRPTSYSGKNKYKGDSDRGMDQRKGRGAPRYDRTKARAGRK